MASLSSKQEFKMKKLKNIWNLITVIAGIIRLAFNPNNLSPIFRMKSIRNHKSFTLCLESMRANPKVNELIKKRYLAPAKYDMAALGSLPEGTLGRVFADHMSRYNLDVEFYPPMEDRLDDDINYVRQRARQTHDIFHVVCDIPAIPIGEMAISSFYLGQHPVPLSAVLIGIGFFVVVFREPHRIDELMRTIQYGYNMGRNSESLFSAKWEEIWDMPIEEVRKKFNIQIDSEFFVRNGAIPAPVQVAS